MGTRVGTPWFCFRSWVPVLSRKPHLLAHFRGNAGEVLRCMQQGQFDFEDEYLGILASDLRPLVDAALNPRQSADSSGWRQVTGMQKHHDPIDETTLCHMDILGFYDLLIDMVDFADRRFASGWYLQKASARYRKQHLLAAICSCKLAGLIEVVANQLEDRILQGQDVLGTVAESARQIQEMLRRPFFNNVKVRGAFQAMGICLQRYGNSTTITWNRKTLAYDDMLAGEIINALAFYAGCDMTSLVLFPDSCKSEYLYEFRTELMLQALELSSSFDMESAMSVARKRHCAWYASFADLSKSRRETSRWQELTVAKCHWNDRSFCWEEQSIKALIDRIDSIRDNHGLAAGELFAKVSHGSPALGTQPHRFLVNESRRRSLPSCLNELDFAVWTKIFIAFRVMGECLYPTSNPSLSRQRLSRRHAVFERLISERAQQPH